MIQGWFSALAGGGGVVAPTVQARAVFISNITSTTFTIEWTNGNGAGRLVLVKPTSEVTETPTNGSSYTANAAYGSGSAIGSGYVVYSGTGSTVNVTGLTANTLYHVAVFEYNDTQYNDELVDNKAQEYSFTTQYQAVVTYANSNAITPVPEDIRKTDNAIVRESVADGSFTTDDLVYMFSGRAAYQSYANLNWKTPGSFTIIPVGGVTFDADGYTGDGTTGYLRTQYIASTNATNYATNNASARVCALSNIAGSQFLFGAAGPTSTRRLLFLPRNASDLWSVAVNSTNTNNTANANSAGNFHLKRTGSANVSVYNNGTLLSTVATTSTNIPNRELYILANNNDGTVAAWSANTIANFQLGASQDGLESALAARWAYEGSDELDFVPDNIYFLRASGQSNASGFDLVDDLTTEQKAKFPNVFIWYNPDETPGGGEWRKLKAGVNNQLPNRLDYFGFEIGLAMEFAANHPNDVLYISKYAVGSTTVATHWNPSIGDEYETSIDAFHTPAFAAVEALFPSDPIIDLGMWWMQGESDANISSGQTSSFVSFTNSTLAAFRSDLGVSDMQIIVGRLNYDSCFYRTYGLDVRTAQGTGTGMICDTALHPDNVFFDTDSYPLLADTNVHWEQYQLGLDLYALLFP